MCADAQRLCIRWIVCGEGPLFTLPVIILSYDVWQWVASIAPSGGLAVSKTKGALDRAGRCVTAAMLYHAGLVDAAHKAALALADPTVASALVSVTDYTPVAWLLTAWETGEQLFCACVSPCI